MPKAHCIRGHERNPDNLTEKLKCKLCITFHREEKSKRIKASTKRRKELHSDSVDFHRVECPHCKGENCRLCNWFGHILTRKK